MKASISVLPKVPELVRLTVNDNRTSALFCECLFITLTIVLSAQD